MQKYTFLIIKPHTLVLMFSFLHVSCLLASDFKSLFDNVSTQYQEAFEEKVKELFDNNLLQLKHVLAPKATSIYIAHARLSITQQDQINRIHKGLTLAGINPLLDFIDNRPGNGISVHQFNDKMYEASVDRILVVGPLNSQNRQTNEFFIDNVVNAQKTKAAPLILLNLTDTDQFRSFPDQFRNSAHELLHMGNTGDLPAAITATFAIIKAIYRTEFFDEICDAEKALYKEIESLSASDAQLSLIQNCCLERHRQDEEKLRQLFGF